MGKNRVEAYSEDRREFERFDVALDGQLLAFDERPISFETLNLSQGGVLFRSHRAFATGSLVHLELKLPQDTRAWSSTARVVRVEEDERGYQIGVKIIHADGADLFRLRKFLDQLARR
jgi:c-di-GMP-binding flagellar brake protein YcgR